MEQQKIANLLNEASDSKYMTRKWNILNDQSNGNYDSENGIIYKTVILKCNLYDYNDAYILVGGNITIAENVSARVAFKNCAPFTKCITKIDGTTIDHAVDFDFVMQMYNLLEYNLILQWCCARDLFKSQIPVNTGGFELRTSCIRSSYLTH